MLGNKPRALIGWLAYRRMVAGYPASLEEVLGRGERKRRGLSGRYRSPVAEEAQ